MSTEKDREFIKKARTIRISRRDFIKGGAAVAGAGILSACGPPAPTASPAATATPVPEPAGPKAGGVLIASYTTDPVGFDPAVVGAYSSGLMIEQAYDTLVEYDDQMNIVPCLAESWEVSDDNLEITLKLKQGIEFHNGKELTSEDVVHTFTRIKDPETGSPRVGAFGNLDSVEAVDKYTARFVLNTEMGPFWAHLASPYESIVPAGSTVEQLQTEMIGTGPFKMVSYEPNYKLVFEKNDNFWKEGLPYLDGVEVRFITDMTAATNAFQAKEVDLLQSVANKDMAMLEAIDGVIGTQLTESCQWNYTGINCTREPFTDPRVRLAISLAKDRQAILDSAFFGYGAPLVGGIVPSWSWAYVDWQYFSPGSDLERARALLEEAGYPDGFDTTMTLSDEYPWHASEGQIHQAELAKLGINVEIITLEWGAFIETIFGNRDFDLQICGWGGPFVDPDEFLYPEFHSDEDWNPQGFSDPEVDRLLELGRNTHDQDERAGIYAEVQKLIAELAPVAAGVNSPFLQTVWDQVKGFTFMPTGMLRGFRETWLDK